MGFVVAAFLWGQHGGGGGSHDHSKHGKQKPAAFDIMRAQLAGVDGGDITLRDINVGGGDIVVNFWATWCAPCVEEMPLFDMAARRMTGIKVVGINMGEERQLINAFLQKVPVEYSLYLGKFDIFYYLRVEGNKGGALPFTILLDGEGNIKNKQLGEFATVDDIVEFATVD